MPSGKSLLPRFSYHSARGEFIVYPPKLWKRTLFIKHHKLLGGWKDFYSKGGYATLGGELDWFFLMGGVTWGNSNSMANIFPNVLFFFMSNSCLKWVLLLIVNLITCFVQLNFDSESWKKDLFQNKKRNIVDASSVF